MFIASSTQAAVSVGCGMNGQEVGQAWISEDGRPSPEVSGSEWGIEYPSCLEVSRVACHAFASTRLRSRNPGGPPNLGQVLPIGLRLSPPRSLLIQLLDQGSTGRLDDHHLLESGSQIRTRAWLNFCDNQPAFCNYEQDMCPAGQSTSLVPVWWFCHLSVAWRTWKSPKRMKRGQWLLLM